MAIAVKKNIRRLKVAGIVLVALIVLGAGLLAGSSSWYVSHSIEQVLAAGTTYRSTTVWDEELSPNYYLVRGQADIDLQPKPGSVYYSELDELGRAGRVVACIDFPMMQAGLERPRAEISHIEPSGWGANGQVEIILPGGKLYHGYFWNRSHLLAKSLGGNDSKENLICGTRTQNVGANDGYGGMSFVEGMVRDWLFSHRDENVLYLVSPVYVGSELVPRSVVVDIRSSDGELDLQIEVFNSAANYEIDYATGEFYPHNN